MTAPSTSDLSWLPVIATLLGGVLALAGSIVVAWFNHKNSVEKARSDRQRERLEDLYRTLVAARKDFQSTLHSAIAKIHGTAEPAIAGHEDIPPIIKTEMLVSLYFKELSPLLRDFATARDAIGAEWGQILVANTRTWPVKERQQKTAQFVDLFESADAAIQALQDAVAASIKA